MIYDIEDVFKKRKPKPIGNYTKSAVTIMLSGDKGKEEIIFEKRSLLLKKQPGDICLPGGKIEAGESPFECAVREAEEELGIKKSNLKYIGSMDFFISPYRSIIYPFIARIESCEIKANRAEVDSIIKVPAQFFLQNTPKLYKLEIGPYLKEDFPYEYIIGGRNYKFSHGFMDEYFYIYKNEVIWGFTAQIIKQFVDIIRGYV